MLCFLVNGLGGGAVQVQLRLQYRHPIATYDVVAEFWEGIPNPSSTLSMLPDCVSHQITNMSPDYELAKHHSSLAAAESEDLNP
ncbi:hypothetical protein ACFX19_042927 [Malus domestica]